MISIDSEVKKRQQLFREAQDKAGVVIDHISKYIELLKKGLVSTIIPHLIIIVDEFAELKVQYPEFMETLERIATIGRTLGIHLVLATQKPAGQIPSKIDVNSRFRLCLKVQSADDSREMIKSPLASEIKEAGRAYFMVQNSDVLNEICKEYGLHIIKNPQRSKGKSYYEWDMHRQGISWKTKLKWEIDECVKESHNFDEFLKVCKAHHIEAVYNPAHKIDLKFRMDGQQKFTRARTLGCKNGFVFRSSF